MTKRSIAPIHIDLYVKCAYYKFSGAARRSAAWRSLSRHAEPSPCCKYNNKHTKGLAWRDRRYRVDKRAGRIQTHQDAKCMVYMGLAAHTPLLMARTALEQPVWAI